MASSPQQMTLFDMIKNPLPYVRGVYLWKDSRTLGVPDDQTAIPRNQCRLLRTPSLSLGYSEQTLKLDQTQWITNQRENQSLLTETDASKFALHELVKPMQEAFHLLGSAFHVSENVGIPMLPTDEPAMRIPSIDYVFDYFDAKSGYKVAYTLLRIVAPCLLRRPYWEQWYLDAFGLVLCQDARRQAARFECPQVCLFDGLTLVRLEFHGYTFQEISDHNCGVSVEVAFDYLHGGQENTKWNPDSEVRNLRAGDDQPSTIRGVLYDVLQSGIRRVACAMLTEPLSRVSDPAGSYLVQMPEDSDEIRSDGSLKMMFMLQDEHGNKTAASDSF